MYFSVAHFNIFHIMNYTFDIIIYIRYNLCYINIICMYIICIFSLYSYKTIYINFLNLLSLVGYPNIPLRYDKLLKPFLKDHFWGFPTRFNILSCHASLIKTVPLKVTGNPEINFFLKESRHLYKTFCYATCILRPPNLW